MTARFAAVATAAFCLLGGVSAPATAEPLMFTVTADHAASARFQVLTDTTVSFDDAQVTTEGTPAAYAGMIVYTDEGRQLGGILTAPSMSLAGQELDPVYFGPPSIVLRKGWHRVVVLTNAAVAIRVPVVGTGLSVNATTPDKQMHSVLSRTLPTGGPVTAELRAPLPRSTANTRVVMVGRLTPAAVDGKFTFVVCASQRKKPCSAGDISVRLTSTRPGPSVTRAIQVGLAAGGRPIAGTRDAVARISLTPAASAPFTFLFVHWNEPKPATPRGR